MSDFTIDALKMEDDILNEMLIKDCNVHKQEGPFSEADLRYHKYTHSADPSNTLRDVPSYNSFRPPSTVPSSVIRSIAMAFTTLNITVMAILTNATSTIF